MLYEFGLKTVVKHTYVYVVIFVSVASSARKKTFCVYGISLKRKRDNYHKRLITFSIETRIA